MKYSSHSRRDFGKIAGNYLGEGMAELRRSIQRKLFCPNATKAYSAPTLKQIFPGSVGVRAQALTRRRKSGMMIFHFVKGKRSLLYAPSRRNSINCLKLVVNWQKRAFLLKNLSSFAECLRYLRVELFSISWLIFCSSLQFPLIRKPFFDIRFMLAFIY